MAAWDVVSTIKAPADQVLAFAAHHLSLGADHLWLFFDDPDAAIPAVLEGHPKVTVTRCDKAYWQAFGKRHERHQNRQARNAREAYGQTKSPWLAHLDVDEFLQADRPVAAILGGIPAEALVVQLEPFEAMHDPGLDDDIFTARTFRGPLRNCRAASPNGLSSADQTASCSASGARSMTKLQAAGCRSRPCRTSIDCSCRQTSSRRNCCHSAPCPVSVQRIITRSHRDCSSSRSCRCVNS